jgi:hypothetical protein
MRDAEHEKTARYLEGNPEGKAGARSEGMGMEQCAVSS